MILESFLENFGINLGPPVLVLNGGGGGHEGWDGEIDSS